LLFMPFRDAADYCRRCRDYFRWPIIASYAFIDTYLSLRALPPPPCQLR
jgi:hypothetical protein